VLRGCASPKEDIEAFLRYCLDNCYTYWLTTHCRGGVNYAPRALEGIVSDDLVKELARKVQATDWGSAKTDAIDFNEPFVWFDDYAFESEVAELKKHDAEDNYFWVDKRDPQAAKEMLQYLKDRLEG
jgi:hypothetical protein